MELSLQLKEREEELSTYEKKYLLSKKNTQLKTAINISEERTLKESSFKESVLKQEVEELKLLLAESHLKLSDEDMIISKDQFKHI
jgi:hypothetical protein